MNSTLTLGQICRPNGGRRIESPYYNKSTVQLKSGFYFDNIEDLAHALSMLGIPLPLPESVGLVPFPRRSGRLEVTLDNHLAVSIARSHLDPQVYNDFFQVWGFKGRDGCSHWHLVLDLVIDDTRTWCKRRQA